MAGESIAPKTLKEWRLERAMTQEEVGLEIGCAGNNVHYWESGHKTPHPRFRRALASVFGCKVTDIIYPKMEQQREARNGGRGSGEMPQLRGGGAVGQDGGEPADAARP